MKDTYSPKNKKARCICTFGNMLGGIYSSGRIHSKKAFMTTYFSLGNENRIIEWEYSELGILIFASENEKCKMYLIKVVKCRQ